MSRLPVLTLILPLLLCPLPAAEVVKLPDLSVRGQQEPSPTHPTVTDTDVAPSASAFSDLLRQTAGLAVNDAGARGFGQTVTLRGLGNTPYFSDPSVTVYLDDLPLASGFTFPSGLYDFNRMTVHRGPQAGAQFGRAGDAGVIQLDSAGAQTGGAEAGGSFGSHGWRAFVARAFSADGTPVSASIQLGASQRDGYITNTTLGRTVDDRQSIFARALLRCHPAESWEMSLQLLGQRTRDGAQALVPLGGPFLEVQRGREGEADTDFAAAALSLSRRTGAGTFKSTTSFTAWNLPRYSNRLVVFGGFDFDSALTQSQRTFTQEVRFGTDRFDGGAFFSHAKTEGAASRAFSGFTVEDSSFETAGDSLALFGRTTLEPAAHWRVSPGLRFEYVAKDFTRRETVPGSSLLQRNDAWKALLPSLALTRNLGDNTDFTVTLARGFKPGGYSAYTGRADLAGYDSQRTWGVEASFSTADSASKWNLISRAYAYRVQGYQIERSFAVPATSTDEYLVVNAGRARILGCEIESAWRMTSAFTLRAVAALTDATLAQFTDPFTGADHAGKRVPYAPTGNAVLRVDYVPARGFFAGAGLSWTGEAHFDEQETEALSQAGYVLIDAHAGYALAHGRIMIFGRNLTDRRYYSSITPGVFHGTPGAPFTWGAEAEWRW